MIRAVFGGHACIHVIGDQNRESTQGPAAVPLHLPTERPPHFATERPPPPAACFVDRAGAADGGACALSLSHARAHPRARRAEGRMRVRTVMTVRRTMMMIVSRARSRARGERLLL
eukprot:965530-Pleurochrysis_carterae.AAC.1